jgi:glucose-1-phosphate thymidylyltransferase
MMEDVIGLVPAAGKGQRLNLPYPKELYPVIRDNRYTPVAQFVLENLRAAAVRHVVVVINETKHQLIGYFGDGHRFGLEISYVVQEQNGSQGGSTSPGLAGALDCSYHLTRNKTVLFGMPDTVMEPVNVFELLLRSSDSEDDASLALFPTTRPEKFGMVRLDDRDRVLEVVDKPGKPIWWTCGAAFCGGRVSLNICEPVSMAAESPISRRSSTRPFRKG